ncbi:hypothetical protein Tco_0736804 [Tanacetum coccineum]
METTSRRHLSYQVWDFFPNEKTCNNDKSLSEIQLDHEKEGELVAVVVKVVHELDCMMVVKEIENGLLEEVEKLEWWFEQDINDEGEEDEEGEGGGMDIAKIARKWSKPDKHRHETEKSVQEPRI